MDRRSELDDPGPTVDGLLMLTADLGGLGVTVARADDFLDRATTTPPGMPTPPASLLDATDDELHAYARELALWRLTSERARDTAAELVKALCAQFAAIIQADADAIVEALRPEFDAGMEAAR